MAARSARLLSDHRRAASARDRGGEASSSLPTHTADVTTTTRGAGSSSRHCTTEPKIPQPCGISASAWRDRTRPGTPRVSVVRSSRAKAANPRKTAGLRGCDRRRADRVRRDDCDRAHFATLHRYEVEPRNEFLALGVANLAAGVFQGYPANASFAQTALADGAGGRTVIAGVTTKLAILATLLVLTPLFPSSHTRC